MSQSLRKSLRSGSGVNGGSSVSGGEQPGDVSALNTLLASSIMSRALSNDREPPVPRLGETSPTSIHCSAHRSRVTNAKSLQVFRFSLARARSAWNNPFKVTRSAFFGSLKRISPILTDLRNAGAIVSVDTGPGGKSGHDFAFGSSCSMAIGAEIVSVTILLAGDGRPRKARYQDALDLARMPILQLHHFPKKEAAPAENGSPESRMPVIGRMNRGEREAESRRGL